MRSHFTQTRGVHQEAAVSQAGGMMWNQVKTCNVMVLVGEPLNCPYIKEREVRSSVILSFCLSGDIHYGVMLGLPSSWSVRKC